MHAGIDGGEESVRPTEPARPRAVDQGKPGAGNEDDTG